MNYSQFLFSQLLMEFSEKYKNMEHDLLYIEAQNLYSEFEQSQFNIDDASEYDCIVEYLKYKTSPLTCEEITEHLFSDETYTEDLKKMVCGVLMSQSQSKVYWDAWFRGAKNKDLENADKGLIYKGF